MTPNHILEIASILKIRSPIQLKSVEILSQLSGYSKKTGLLEDELRRELKKENIGTGSIKTNINKLIALGLLEIRPGQSERYALVRIAWDAKPKHVEGIFQIALDRGKDRRSDMKAGTIVKDVKSIVVSSGKLKNALPHKLYVAVVNCALITMHDWHFKNGIVERCKSTSPGSKIGIGPSNSKKSKGSQRSLDFEESSQVKKDKHNQTEHVNSAEIPNDVKAESCDIEELLDGSLERVTSMGGTVHYNNNVAEVELTLTRSRKQRIFVIYRRDSHHSPFFWAYTKCGEIGHEKAHYLDAFLLNNLPETRKVTLLNFSDKRKYLGCCCSVPHSPIEPWKDELYKSIHSLANFGDQLEDMYWGEDRY